MTTTAPSAEPAAPARQKEAAPASPVALHPAARLADSLNIPVTLPIGYRGAPIANLSHTSLMRWESCPDDWRRHYLLGERGPKSGAMFLGTIVDDTITTYYWLRKAGSALELDQLRDAFRDLWDDKLAQEQQPVAWEPYLRGDRALEMGLEAIDITYRQLVPRIGEPVDTQRAFELRLAPQLQWTIKGYVDLDTVRTQRTFVDDDGQAYAIQDTGEPVPTVTMAYRDAPPDLREPVKFGRTTYAPDDAIEFHARALEDYEEKMARIEEHGLADGEKQPRPPKELPDIEVPVDRLARFGDVVEKSVAGIVDYKVRNSPVSANQAHADSQASLYLAERWIENVPCQDFRFAQVAKPGAKRQNMSTALVTTSRTAGRMRAILLRYAMAATQIVAAYEAFGPEQPWGFAPEGHWKCMPDADSAQRPGGPPTRGRHCIHFQGCPMGLGLWNR